MRLVLIIPFSVGAGSGSAEKLKELHEGNDQDEGRYEPEVKTSVLAGNNTVGSPPGNSLA